MEIKINIPMYNIYLNGKKIRRTSSWRKANEIYNMYYYDMFEHNYVEIKDADTGEILKGGAR